MQQVSNASLVVKRKRNFLLVIPILVYPFLTFLLWSIGLLKNPAAANPTVTASKGFNMQLPDAKTNENKDWNKLDYYDQADKDSLKRKEIMLNDPYYKDGLFKKTDAMMESPSSSHSLFAASLNNGQNVADENVNKINQQLMQLKSVMTQNSAAPVKQNNLPSSQNISVNANDVNRLSTMMQSMQQKEADPEMQQLNGMMEKILDIQHPERVKEKIKEQSKINKQTVYAVTPGNSSDAVSLLQANDNHHIKDTSIKPLHAANGFYSLDTNMPASEESNSIQAVIHETQTLVSGATVKLRLLSDVMVNGILIPKDNFVYGVVSLSDERMNISISTLRYQNNILPVALSVYDEDGLPGLYIPGAESRDVVKESAGDAVQRIGLTSLDPSIGMQAANIGLQAAKNFLGKKVKIIRVTVKAGYHVLLRDTNQHSR